MCLGGWLALLVASAPSAAGRSEPGTGRDRAPVARRAAGLFPAVRRLVERGRAERRERELLAALATLADLLRVAVSVGATARAAVEVVARHAGPIGCDLDTVVAAVRAGESFDDAVRTWAVRTGGPAHELGDALVESERRGVPVGATLGRLARDLRRRRRRRAEAAARRLSVKILLPLVACILPAFGLLVVAPVVVAGVARIATQ